MNIVLDTNCLVMSLSATSKYHDVWTGFRNGHYTLCYTTEILLEYEEVFTRKMGPEIAKAVLKTMLKLPNVMKIERIHYRWNLITADPDDNKFVDCAFAANARYIVSEDRHYDVLRNIDYPRIEVIDIEHFLRILQETIND